METSGAVPVFESVTDRAAAAVFAMQHGLVWGELPMEEGRDRS